MSWAFHFSRVLDFRAGGNRPAGVKITLAMLVFLVGTMAPVTASAQAAPQPTSHLSEHSTMLTAALAAPAPAYFMPIFMSQPMRPRVASGCGGALVSATSTSPFGST